MSKYTIVKDTEANEYALLFTDRVEDTLKDSHKMWAKGQKNMGPEHLFWNGGKKIKPFDLKGVPKKTVDIGIPVIHFYGKDKKVYDRRCIHLK